MSSSYTVLPGVIRYSVPVDVLVLVNTVVVETEVILVSYAVTVLAIDYESSDQCSDLMNVAVENLLGVMVVLAFLTIVVVDGPRPRKLEQNALRVGQCDRNSLTLESAVQLGARRLANSSGTSARATEPKHSPTISWEKRISKTGDSASRR